MTKSKPVKPADHEVTVAEACRDVLTAAINKGQLPGLFVGVIVLVIVWRLPEGELSKLANRIIDNLHDGSMLGWAMFVVAISALVVYHIRSRALLHRLTDRYPALLAELKDNPGEPPPKGGKGK